MTVILTSKRTCFLLMFLLFSIHITTSIYPVPCVNSDNQIADWFGSLAECLHWNVRQRQRQLSITDCHVWFFFQAFSCDAVRKTASEKLTERLEEARLHHNKNLWKRYFFKRRFPRCTSTLVQLMVANFTYVCGYHALTNNALNVERLYQLPGCIWWLLFSLQ